MGCGSKYAYLVQAAGRTKAKPFDNWCNVEDAQAWYSQAQSVRQMVQIAIAGKTLPSQLSAQIEAYKNATAKLPKPSQTMAFGFGGCSEAVNAAITNIELGACMLEQIEGAGAAVHVPGSTLPPSSSIFDFTGPLTGIAGMIAIYFLVQALEKR